MDLSFNKEFMAIRFANNVPEYSGKAFATAQQAIEYAQKECFDYSDLSDVYIVQLCGIVGIKYVEKY